MCGNPRRRQKPQVNEHFTPSAQTSVHACVLYVFGVGYFESSGIPCGRPGSRFSAERPLRVDLN